MWCIIESGDFVNMHELWFGSWQSACAWARKHSAVARFCNVRSVKEPLHAFYRMGKKVK
jgi:hypothetical protein